MRIFVFLMALFSAGHIVGKELGLLERCAALFGRLVNTITVGSPLHGYAHNKAVTYPDGTVVTPVYYRGRFNAVHVRKGNHEVTYERSHHPIERYEIPSVLKQFLTNGTYSGMQVLDVGAGGGQAVEDMREKGGVIAHGLDLILDENQKNLSYYHQAMMAQTPFNDGKFQLVVHNQSFFTYGSGIRPGEKDFEKGINTLRELMRITEIGHYIVLGHTDVESVEASVNSIPQLKIKRSLRKPDEKWVVIKHEGTRSLQNELPTQRYPPPY